MKRVYGITIVFEKTGEEKQTLRFEIEVISKKDEITKKWLFQFDKRNEFINNRKPDLIAEKIAVECGKVIYPLQIEVGNNWSTKVVKSRKLAISQLKEFEEKTKMIYKSSFIDTYFLKTWETLNDPEKYLRAIEQNMFLSFFFAPLYLQYNALDDTAETIMNLPIVPFTKPIEYSIKQKVSPKQTRFNTVTVNQKGTITDKRTQKDISNGFDEPIFIGKGQSKSLMGKFISKYELHSATNIIHSLTAEADISLEDSKKLAFQLQAYYLPERDKIAAQSKFINLTELKQS
ncbi:hypothetical protein I2486_18305 [Cellulophaga sp. E16_2]|uniref:hypothetical protein n=1 Tax=Cellulophaga sp. E16_2 TaxID=2789297 RepID=UPI001A93A69D|nr:hypothetical protein [Cellulophaga sp. E16_2]MBO0593359.1 hypothetical protein [Cellulophaga sp. E16_2]